MTTVHTYLVVYKRHGVRETTQSGSFGMEIVELYNIARKLILIRQRKKKKKKTLVQKPTRLILEQLQLSLYSLCLLKQSIHLNSRSLYLCMMVLGPISRRS